MTTLASLLVASAAAIVLLVGLAHIAYTFHGPKLLPRDVDLQARMAAVSPVITRQTTMWKAWIGFNASHGMGLVLFGAVYGYLALAQRELLFGSIFLRATGLLVLLGYVWLCGRYFFRSPLRIVMLATGLYVVALVVCQM